MNKRKAKCVVTLASILVMVFVAEVQARSATGQVNATVISAIAPTPVAIRLRTSPSPVLDTSTGFGFSSFQSIGGFKASQQPTITLICIDDHDGVASFSVSGDVTSGYVIRAAGTDDSVVQTQTASQTCAALTAANAAAGLIVPAQMLIGGGRLSIEISKPSLLRPAGNMIVVINYN